MNICKFWAEIYIFRKFEYATQTQNYDIDIDFERVYIDFERVYIVCALARLKVFSFFQLVFAN